MRTNVETGLEEAKAAGDPTRLEYGIVTDDSPLTVVVGGSTVALPARALVSAGIINVDDFVAVLVRGADRLVLGKVDI